MNADRNNVEFHQNVPEFRKTLLAYFVELIPLFVVEFRGEIRAECHDEKGDAEEGVDQVENGQEPEFFILNEFAFRRRGKRTRNILKKEHANLIQR